MTIYNLYSKQKKGLPDVFIYDNISDKLKNQIFHIWNDFFKGNNLEEDAKKELFQRVYDILCREEGKKNLVHIYAYPQDSPIYQVEQYFEELNDTDKILDVVHVVFDTIERFQRFHEREKYMNFSYTSNQAIQVLNYRFRENGVGYEYSNGYVLIIKFSIKKQSNPH